MLRLMNALKRIVVSLLMVSLVACGVVTPVPTTTVRITTTITPPFPTATVSLPTPTRTTISTSSFPVPSAPNGLRMAYVIDGNLYFQEGNNLPVQLTGSGEDRNPVFSDDGERLIFYRGLIPHDLYSVNVDATQEQTLVTGSLLEDLGFGYDKFTEVASLAFVPGTHDVLFNTRQLSQADIDQKDFNRLGSKANYDLLSVDADTGEIVRLLPNGKGGNFFLSPNGNMVAIQASGHIDVIDIDGRTIRPNFISYTPTYPYDLSPKVFWNADSTELIATLPAREIFDMSGPETLSVWRYSIDSSRGVQVAIDPPLLDSDYAVSPDGNWILYNYFYYPGKTAENVISGLYLGNLRDGSTQLYAPGIATPVWSLDSTHFIYDGLFLGGVDSSPQPIGEGRLLGWGDATRYLYIFDGEIVIGKVDGGVLSIPVGASGKSPAGWPDLFTFIFLDT